MPENVDNLILEHLRAMRSDITALRDDTREVKSRLTSLETAVSAMRREIADLYTDVGVRRA
jgi:predicted  nucleic acid-binding Zn-ribbon protein